VTREVNRCSNQSEVDLQDALSAIDWMFLSSSGDISEFTDAVTSFIATLVDTIVPMVKVRSFPNQKLWVDGSIRNSLLPTTKRHPMDSSVKDAKRRDRDRVESQMEQCDTRLLWQGLNNSHTTGAESPKL